MFFYFKGSWTCAIAFTERTVSVHAFRSIQFAVYGVVLFLFSKSKCVSNSCPKLQCEYEVCLETKRQKRNEKQQ